MSIVIGMRSTKYTEVVIALFFVFLLTCNIENLLLYLKPCAELVL